jgi:hypothetical protein
MLKFRFAMNHMRNSIGGTLLGMINSKWSLVSSSCRSRVLHDVTRVFLATLIYRSEHSGALPPSADDFVPLLGGWPRDAFNGKPMIYSPQDAVVYSVGEDLIDHGGEIYEFGSDVGISLTPESRAKHGG